MVWHCISHSVYPAGVEEIQLNIMMWRCRSSLRTCNRERTTVKLLWNLNSSFDPRYRLPPQSSSSDSKCHFSIHGKATASNGAQWSSSNDSKWFIFISRSAGLSLKELEENIQQLLVKCGFLNVAVQNKWNWSHLFYSYLSTNLCCCKMCSDSTERH